MAGFKGGRGGYKKPKNIGRGMLESVMTDGPHNDWLGMPPYWIHSLTIDGEAYTYFSDDKELGIDEGKKVTFRYRDTKKGVVIEKRSLGVVIDPSELT